MLDDLKDNIMVDGRMGVALIQSGQYRDKISINGAAREKETLDQSQHWCVELCNSTG